METWSWPSVDNSDVATLTGQRTRCSSCYTYRDVGLDFDWKAVDSTLRYADTDAKRKSSSEYGENVVRSNGACVVGVTRA